MDEEVYPANEVATRELHERWEMVGSIIGMPEGGLDPYHKNWLVKRGRRSRVKPQILRHGCSDSLADHDEPKQTIRDYLRHRKMHPIAQKVAIIQ